MNTFYRISTRIAAVTTARARGPVVIGRVSRNVGLLRHLSSEPPLTSSSQSSAKGSLGESPSFQQKSNVPPSHDASSVSEKLAHLDQIKSLKTVQPDDSPTKHHESKPDKLYKTIELEIMAYQEQILDSYEWFVLTSASHLHLNVGKIWRPIRPSRHLTVANKSVHVHKKARDHYEVRTYHRFINLHKLTGSTADTFLEYIERNLPESVGLRVTKCEVLPLPDFLKPKPESEKDSS